MTFLKVALVVVGLWLAAIWQQSTIGDITLLGQKSAPLLIIVVLVGLRTRPGWAAVVGFAAGLLQGGPAGANLTAYCLSRTVVAFACSFVSRTGLSLNPFSVGALCAGATIFAQLSLLFLAPPPDIGRFLGATMGTAIYNGVIAGLMEAILRKTLEKPVD